MFLLSLAGHLNMTMEHLANTMSAAELDMWAKAYQYDPWGPERGDMQAAVIASTIANANAPKGKSYTVSDYMPTFGKRTDAGSTQSPMDQMRAIASATSRKEAQVQNTISRREAAAATKGK